jgi:hypothetical protein
MLVNQEDCGGRSPDISIIPYKAAGAVLRSLIRIAQRREGGRTRYGSYSYTEDAVTYLDLAEAADAVRRVQVLTSWSFEEATAALSLRLSAVELSQSWLRAIPRRCLNEWEWSLRQTR